MSEDRLNGFYEAREYLNGFSEVGNDANGKCVKIFTNGLNEKTIELFDCSKIIVTFRHPLQFTKSWNRLNNYAENGSLLTDDLNHSMVIMAAFYAEFIDKLVGLTEEEKEAYLIELVVKGELSADEALIIASKEGMEIE